MKKQIQLVICFTLSLMTLVACGMTQELEQSLDTTKELSKQLTNQYDTMQSTISLSEKMIKAYETDIEQFAGDNILKEEDSELFKNYSKRVDILEEINKDKKKLGSYKKELERIVNNQAVDVDNEALTTIRDSLDIIINNIEAIKPFMESSLSQEKELYQDLNEEAIVEKIPLLERTNGSIILLAEETCSNILYTKDLINNFQKSAQSPSHK